MKHILLTTVAAATLSSAAFANPVSTAICADHSDPALCEAAIDSLADLADAYAEQNRKVYNAGFGSFDALIEAANTPVEVIVEVPVIKEVIVEVEVDADDSDLISHWAAGKEEGYSMGLVQGHETAYNDGFDVGRNQGLLEGLEQGKAVNADAADVAFAAGSDEGYAMGYDAGLVDGDVVGRELNRLLGDTIASYNVSDMKVYFDSPTDFVHSVYGQIAANADAVAATADLEDALQAETALREKQVDYLWGKVHALEDKVETYRRIAKHVVGWVKDYGPQAWIAEQANNMLGNQLK